MKQGSSLPPTSSYIAYALLGIVSTCFLHRWYRMALFIPCSGGSSCRQGDCLASLSTLLFCVASSLTLIFFRSRCGLVQHRLRARAGPADKIALIKRVNLTILEFIALFIDLASCAGLLLLQNESLTAQCGANLIFLISSIYLLFLLSQRRNGAFQGLPQHSICLYITQWFITASMIGSVQNDPFDSIPIAITFCRFVIYTILCIVHSVALVMANRASLHTEKNGLTPSKEESVGHVSRLTFSWTDSLVYKAFQQPLEATDLFRLGEILSSKHLLPLFRRCAPPKLGLAWRLFQFIKYDYFWQCIWASMGSTAVYVPPILMRIILEYLEDQTKISYKTAWVCVGGLFLSGILVGLFDCHCNWTGRKIGVKIRSVLLAEIYSKVLRQGMTRKIRSTGANEDQEHKEESNGDGNTINLISVDVDFVCFMSENFYMIWVVFPVQTAIGAYLLFDLLGISGILGILVMIALLPLNVLVSKYVMNAQAFVLEASDRRIQSSNEIFQNIRTIKFCAWESPFKEKVLAARGLELVRLRLRFLWWSISMTLFHVLPFVVTVITCLLYTIVWHGEFGTSIAFPALAIFTILRIPIDRLADSITFTLQANVSLKRIAAFLGERETAKKTKASHSDGGSVGFHKATMAWPTDSKDDSSSEIQEEIPLQDVRSTDGFRLEDITVDFPEGTLTTICGPSGSGKSSLLLAFLGEMVVVSGRVSLPHGSGTPVDLSMDPLSTNSAYCPQEPWIMNRTIRQNILMGLPFNSPRYEEVLRATALMQDLAALSQHDQTLAGEHGNRLSGGQKQRVALARALYSHAKYVVLDDCLSAVDSHTANHIFFNAIKGSLMDKRSCIMATHHKKLAVPLSDQVVLLDAGRVAAQGTAKDLVTTGYLGSEFLKREEKEAPLPEGMEKHEASSKPALNAQASRVNQGKPASQDVEADVGESSTAYSESKVEGAVPWQVITAYLKAMGSAGYWTLLLLGFAAQEIASLGTSLWIKQWAYQYDMAHYEAEQTLEQPSKHTSALFEVAAGYYLGIYCVICLAYALVTFSRNLFAFHGSVQASRRIFAKLLDSTLYAKLSFFDRTPLGQITNRFSRDIEILDQSISTFSISLFQLIATLIGIAILISIYLPAFLFVAIVIGLAYYGVTSLYIGSARDLKRIEAVQRSPLYQLFSETMAGCVSIRAYAQTLSFATEAQKLVDNLNEPILLQSAAKEWLTLRVSVLSSLISLATGSFVLWQLKSIDPGAAALAMTLSSSVTENVLWLVQVYAIVQQNLSSVERIHEYTEGIECEPKLPLKQPREAIPYNWPTHGGIDFKDYTARYAPELKPALSNVTFSARPGERVAIVGRTGAGKSTLSLALVRALEADPPVNFPSEDTNTDSHRILIDGIDIASVTLQRLRQAITVVPQDPQLFAGSVRDNLSPMRDHTDDEMLESLRVTGLLYQGNTSKRAEYTDLDRGANDLSRGQRQLLCIARGLLRRTRVLVLDEATASLDQAADTAIQAGLLRATQAAGVTVLTIAHKLLTIADYDQVIVLDDGRVVEKGRPQTLLRTQTIFRKLCEEGGDVDEIERIARTAADKTTSYASSWPSLKV